MKTHEAAARAAMDQYASMNAPLPGWHLDERSPIQTDLFGAAEEILEVGGGGSSRTTEEEQPKAEARGSEDFLDCQEDDKGEESVPEIEREPTSGILFLVIVQLDVSRIPASQRLSLFRERLCCECAWENRQQLEIFQLTKFG